MHMQTGFSGQTPLWQIPCCTGFHIKELRDGWKILLEWVHIIAAWTIFFKG
jgi:hypothetical protein